jgi:hypothetical protein
LFERFLSGLLISILLLKWHGRILTFLFMYLHRNRRQSSLRT